MLTKIKRKFENLKTVYENNYSPAIRNNKEIEFTPHYEDVMKYNSEDVASLVFTGSVIGTPNKDVFKYIQPNLNYHDYSISFDNNEEYWSQDLFSLVVHKNYLIDNHNNSKFSHIVNIKGIKIGFIRFGNKITSKTLSKRVRNLKTEGAEYIIGLYTYKSYRYSLIKLATNCGIQYIVGNSQSDQYKMYYNVSRKSKRKVPYVRTLGTLSSTNFKREVYRDSILLTLKLKRVDNTVILIEDSYQPVFNAEKINGEKDRPIPLNMFRSYTTTNERLILSRRRIGARFPKLDENRNILNFNKAFSLLDIKLPTEIQNLKDIKVSRLTNNPGLTFENSIYFVIPYDETYYDQSEEEYYDEIRSKFYNRNIRYNNIVIFTPVSISNNFYQYYCDNPINLQLQLQNFLIKSFDIKYMIGITGSAGKTTTKELLFNVMNSHYKTLRSNLNNNLWGLSRVIERLNPSYEAYVQELGGGKKDMPYKNGKMLDLNIGIITNIGDAHLKVHGSKEGLFNNKIALASTLREPNNVMVLNIDDVMLREYARNNSNIITISMYDESADFFAYNINESQGQIDFFVNHNTKKTKVTLSMNGEHNIYNALAAFAVGIYTGVPVKKIKTGLKLYKPDGIRQSIETVSGMVIYTDTFNSSPSSAKASIDNFDRRPIRDNQKKLVVLGDFTGLGDLTEQGHKDFGKYLLSTKIDSIILFGEYSKFTYEVMVNSRKDVKYFNDVDILNDYLTNEISNFKFILFKASSQIQMETNVIDEVLGTNYAYHRLKSFGNKTQQTELFKVIKTLKFIMIKHFKAHKYSEEHLIVPNYILDLPVKTIEESAFKNNSLREVKFNYALKSIGEYAFCGSKNLERILFFDNLQNIYDNAFANCTNLSSVEMSNGIWHIGSKAFCNCTKLEEIKLPASLKYISDDAFDGSRQVLFLVEKDTYAHKWVKDKRLNFNVINEVNQGEYINIFENGYFNKPKEFKLTSNNGLAAYCLQTGEVFGYREGSALLTLTTPDGEVTSKEIFVKKSNNTSLPLLLSRHNGVPEDYVPNSLHSVSDIAVRDAFLEKETELAFRAMREDAKKDGINLLISYGFRSFQWQDKNVKKSIEKDGEEKTFERYAPAGFSQHQTGLAIDVRTEPVEDKPKMYDWLENNCYKFGFILKNLKGKEHITLTMYEPWHIYYLGDISIAKTLRDEYLTLEEYLYKYIVHRNS